MNSSTTAEILTFSKPPFYLEIISECLCDILNIKNPCWTSFKNKFIRKHTLLVESLLNFDFNSISEQKVNNLRYCLEDPNFSIERIARIGFAAVNLAKYVINLYKYFELRNELKKFE